MANENVPNTDNWDDFSGKWLKIELVKKFPALFIPVSVKSKFDDEENAHLIYTGEFDGKIKDWEPNKTNVEIIKNSKLLPKELIGKKVWFKQVMNFNPNLKKKVPALEIDKIE